MKYTNPDIKIMTFKAETVTTDGTAANMDPVTASNYTEATISLQQRFETAADKASTVLVFKWQ